MAILMDNKDFGCSCGCIQFKKESLKSYSLKRNQVLVEETNHDFLICSQCGQRYDLNNLGIRLLETIE